jgi:hypothetical protein
MSVIELPMNAALVHFVFAPVTPSKMPPDCAVKTCANAVPAMSVITVPTGTVEAAASVMAAAEPLVAQKTPDPVSFGWMNPSPGIVNTGNGGAGCANVGTNEPPAVGISVSP